MNQILADVRSECGWMYRTISNGNKETDASHTVWSEVLVCGACSQEIGFWDVAVNRSTGAILDELQCPGCGALFAKRDLKRATEAVYNPILKKVTQRAKYRPVAIRGLNSGFRAERPLNSMDTDVNSQVQQGTIPYWYPTTTIERDIDMWYERDYRSLGLYTVDGFYTKRNLWCLSALWDRARHEQNYRVRAALLFTLTGMVVNLSNMNRWRHNVSFPYNPLSGTLYVPALPVESNVLHGVRNKAVRLAAVWSHYALPGKSCTSTQSSAALPQMPDNCVDYIFTDPPFGSNIIYSDLSLLFEAWLGIETNIEEEAVVHRRKRNGRSLQNYQLLMAECFRECLRVLKPGRWLTVVFHNTRNAVWNAIQEALNQAGFVVADIRILDKVQGSFKQVTAAGAVKQDLVISVYKPNDGLEERFGPEAGTEEGVWDFVRSHLGRLPVFVLKDEQVEVVAERQDFLLFDRMVAFHVQRGVTVPLSASEFYAGLEHRFPKRDGMYFLPEQSAEYDKKRLTVKEVLQLQLFVTDEASAIQWLKQQLIKKPKTFQEIHPHFLKELSGWQKHEKPLELSDLLRQNFLCYEGNVLIPSQIVSWLKESGAYREKIRQIDGSTMSEAGLETTDPELLQAAKDRWYVPDPNRASDLERLRERALLKEFEEYRHSKQRKLKVFRFEAIRAGFGKAWKERDYHTIIEVAQKIPDEVLREDAKLLMWYDQALTRTGKEDI